MDDSDYGTDSVVDADEEGTPNVHKLLKIVILAVIGIVCVFGNLIALWIVIFHRSLRTSIYVIIAGLALADIIDALMNVPEYVLYHVDKGELKSAEWCQAFGFLSSSCEYIAAFHLVVLVVLRGILLTERVHHGPRSIPALVTSGLLWLVGLLANIPTIHSTIIHPFSLQCVVKINADDGEDKDGLSLKISSADERYIIINAVFSYFLPVVLIIIIYIFTGYMSKRYFEDSYSPRERRMSKMISCIIVVFALCRLPAEMVKLLYFYQAKNYFEQNPGVEAFINSKQDRQKLQVWIHVRQYLNILAMIDMALRPVIYATMSREFGVIYDKVINCTYCKENETDNTRMKMRQQEITEVLTTPIRQPVVSIEYQGSDEEIQELDNTPLHTPLHRLKHYEEREEIT